QMANVEGTGGIRQCYTDIVKAEKTEDWNSALKATNRLLKKFTKEGKIAFKCKLIALIQLGLWEDALLLIKKTPAAEMGAAHFEKAYIHYRTNENEESLEELSKCHPDDVRALELKAQLLYRLDRFQEAYDVYKHLMKNHSDEQDEERKANIVAVEAQLASIKQNTVSLVDSLDTFEQLYNSACVDIETDKLNDAHKKLDKALPLARESLAESDLTEEEMEEESASIALQKAFVLHKMGDIQMAAEMYKKIESVKSGDKSVQAALLNNLASISHRSNLNDARKKLKSATQIDKTKLSRHQRFTLLLNQALVLLHSNQREPAKRAIDDLVKEYGSLKEAELTEAALHWKGGDSKKAVAAIPSNDKVSILARTHILVNLGKWDDALNELQNLPVEVKKKSGIVSLIAAIQETKGDVQGAVNTLDTARKGWKGKELACVLDTLATLATTRERHTEAATYLEELNKVTPDDVSVISRLIRAYSYVDTAKADALRERAFPEGSSEGVDVDELEESDWILYGDKYKQRKEAKEGIEKADTEIVTGKLRKRKRKRTILPKNFDPNVKPDPERWLPKEERTAYKKKRKNREREVGRGTQGSAAAPSVEYKGAEGNTSSPRPTPNQSEPRQHHKTVQQKKKKGKGNKF
ncbi:srpa-72, partial [Pristionchus pacificus]